jgi:hypothetical protein
MCDRTQAGKAQEATCTLDGMDGSEDARKNLAGCGILFQSYQVTVKLVKVLIALDEEIFNDVIHVAHC